jgi:hypothetical protein
MTNQPLHRYQIWTLAPAGNGIFDSPAAVPTRRDPLVREKRRYAELLVDPAAGVSAGPAKSDGGAGSLYHYGLPIEIALPGLCTLANGRSSAFLTEKISSDLINFIYDEATPGYRFKLPDDLPVGTPMRLDLDRIGEFHGALAAQNLRGFKVAVAGECRSILSNRLAVLAAAIRNADPEDPCMEAKTTVTRLEPETKNCRFTDPSGVLRKGLIINVSRIDALIKAPVVPPVGAQVAFAGPGHREARVSRAFEIGFAVNFCEPIPEGEFSASIKFLDE